MTEAALLNRLDRYGYGQHYGPMAKACAEAAAEIRRLRKGIQDYVDGNYEPKIVGKIDKCSHGQFGYEACEACIDEHFTKLLGG